MYAFGSRAGEIRDWSTHEAARLPSQASDVDIGIKPVSRRIVTGRIAYVDEMVGEIESLPLGTMAAFKADKRNVWSAESCLRRALEALFDIGRHMAIRDANARWLKENSEKVDPSL